MRLALVLAVALWCVVGVHGQADSEMVAMRDGVRLYTSIRGADQNDPKPVILQRTTYGGNAGVNAGFVTIMQHQRGTRNSEGRFQTWRQDHEDTMDTLEWINAQPWSNGDVYTEGPSALGIPQYAAASSPGLELNGLKAQIPRIAAADGRSVVFPGGAFRQALLNRWMTVIIRDSREVLAELRENEAPGEWWDPLTLDGKESNVKWPAIHYGGWYDIFSNGQIMGFNAYQWESGDGGRGNSWLVMEPCGHCAGSCTGGKYQGSSGRNPQTAATSLVDALRSHLFMGEDSVPPGLKPVTFFVMGPDQRVEPNAVGNFFTTLDEWPVPRTVQYYLHHDGSLNQTAPGVFGGFSSYEYDPRDPTPTIGGNNLMIACGPLDQTPKESRDDVLLFTTEVLQDDVIIVGTPTLTAFVSSSAVDTDFAFTLSDVTPSGDVELVIDGILRMKWRNEGAGNVPVEPELMVPGQTYEVEIEAWPMAYVFGRGHRIRILVSSANNPRFDANSNTGLPISDDPTPVVAENTIYHNSASPSALNLPVVTLDQLPEYIVDL